MGQYYCMEIDPSGHVMDYSASYYRKFDYEWNFKSLEICSIKDEKGYIVAGRLSVSELLELGIDLEEFIWEFSEQILQRLIRLFGIHL